MGIAWLAASAAIISGAIGSVRHSERFLIARNIALLIVGAMFFFAVVVTVAATYG
jgi:hypothetical protein